MLDDNIINFPEIVHLQDSDNEVLEVMECDNCANKTWQVSPEGSLQCPICRITFDFKGYLLDV